jgi:hypothetical protein
VSKVLRWRYVPLERGAVKWLRWCRRFVKGHADTETSFRDGGSLRLAKRARVVWHQDILRKTAASFLMAKYQDAQKVSEWLGNSPNILKKHYRNLKTPEEAALFWAGFQRVKAVTKLPRTDNLPEKWSINDVSKKLAPLGRNPRQKELRQNENFTNLKQLTESKPDGSHFKAEPTAKEKQEMIERITGQDLPAGEKAKRFFELRGLYNRGQIGLQLAWNALSVANDPNSPAEIVLRTTLAKKGEYVRGRREKCRGGL